jgi:A/G-specific adenine glycosylase
VDELGPRVRVDYAPEGTYGREWLAELLGDLEDDGLVAFDADKGRASLRE